MLCIDAHALRAKHGYAAIAGVPLLFSFLAHVTCRLFSTYLLLEAK